MIALLAARGLEALPGRARRFAALSAVGFSLVTVFAVQAPFLQWVNTANLRDAGRWLDARGVREAAVAVLPTPGIALNPEVAVPLLDYHTAARLVAVGGPQAAAAAGGAARLLVPLQLGGAAPGVVPRRCRAGEPARRSCWSPATRARRRRRRSRTASPDAPPTRCSQRDAVFRFRTFVSVWLPKECSGLRARIPRVPLCQRGSSQDADPGARMRRRKLSPIPLSERGSEGVCALRLRRGTARADQGLLNDPRYLVLRQGPAVSREKTRRPAQSANRLRAPRQAARTSCSERIWSVRRAR